MAASMCASYSLPGVAAVHYGRGTLFRETEIEIGEPGIGGPPGGAVPCHAAGKFTSRPEIALHHTFETPGLYKLWGQFQTHDGAIVTADFVVRVAQ